MERECERVTSIGELLSLAPDHPRRIHADECPRCRSLLTAYEEYSSVFSATDTGLEEARPRLDAFVDNLVANEPLVEPVVSPRRGLFQWIKELKGMRVGLAAAAVALVVVSAYLWLPQGDAPDRMVLRGDDDTSRAQGFVLHTPETIEGGHIRLLWSPHPDAETYGVRLFSPDHGEILYLEAIADTTIVFAVSELSPAPAPGTQLLWTVSVNSHGDELFDSVPGMLMVP